MAVGVESVARTVARNSSRALERASFSSESSIISREMGTRIDSFSSKSTPTSSKAPKTTGFRAACRRGMDRFRAFCGKDPKYETGLKKSPSRASTVDLDTDEVLQQAEEMNQHYNEQINRYGEKINKYSQDVDQNLDCMNKGMEAATAQFDPTEAELREYGLAPSPKQHVTSANNFSSPTQQLSLQERFERLKSKPMSPKQEVKAPNLEITNNIALNLRKSAGDLSKDQKLVTSCRSAQASKKSDSVALHVKVAQGRLGQIDSQLQSVNAKLNGKLMSYDRTFLKQTRENLLLRQATLRRISN